MAKAAYILYRILGNDLPPRHRNGQTLSNLKKILEHEPVFKGVEKRWIINRIVDPLVEQKIIRLLDKYQQIYHVIHFDRRKFKKIPHKLYEERLDEMIGLNSARNFALKEGKRLGRWVLLFDGNCLLTSLAWQDIQKAFSQKGNFKYIIVPMLRMVQGEGGMPCEPQIIFRYDSKERFDRDFRYGQNSKVELLVRLGVPGLWDQWDTEQKVHSQKRRSKEFGCFISAGHVWRLPSGNEVADRDVKRREAYRKQGIKLMMEKIDKMSV